MALKKAIENDRVLRQTFIFLSLGAPGSIPAESAVEYVSSHIVELPEESKISRSSVSFLDQRSRYQIYEVT